MLKKMIERSVRKQIALTSLEYKTSSVIVEHMKHERREKEKAIAEVLELKEKLEASDRREKSLHKELEECSKELFDLRNTFKDLSEPVILKVSPREEAKIQLNGVFGKPFDWDKLKKQLDGNSDNLTDEDVNNLPFYTLEYSVDGQQESLINLSLHDCEELYGQIIGSLEYFKMTKQEKYIEDVHVGYSAFGSVYFEEDITFTRGALYVDDILNSILSDGRMNRCNKFTFYKNGKLICEMSAYKFLHTKWRLIREELLEKEKEIDQK